MTALGKLFSITIDYEGGSYFAQATAPSARAALKVWAKEVDEEHLKVYGMSRSDIYKIANCKPIPLRGMVNAWDASVVLSGKVATVRIIATKVS